MNNQMSTDIFLILALLSIRMLTVWIKQHLPRVNQTKGLELITDELIVVHINGI
jgi:hypothetical protein